MRDSGTGKITKRERKMKTLFERFGIPTPENFEDYNLIGIDFGDGELSASFVELERDIKNDSGEFEIDESNEGRISVLQLSLAPNGTLYKNVNAFYHSPTKTELIYDVSDTRLDSGLSGSRYYNYKKCPGDITADSLFQKDDKTTGSISYRQAMIEGFNCVVDTLFKSNLRISREKPTIILVGRPSSAGWESSELEYARMLRKGLKLPAGQKEVYIAIEPESTAALASEMDPKYEKQRVNRKEIVVILDSGSSTFDVTVVGPNGVVGEDSYQFGGNQLDENLLALLRSSVAAYSPGAELESEHGHKLALRILKEGYYGIKGTGQMKRLYTPDLKNVNQSDMDEEFEFRIDKKTMKKALEEMPVRAFRFEKGLNGMLRKTQPVTYKSWLGACEAIYSSFYEKMKGHFTKQGDEHHPFVPDRIILSGGVSVMPEVQEAVKRAFGVEPTISPRPNYSVSQGLGYVLGTEVRKKQLLTKLFSELENELPGVDSLLKSIGDAGEDEEWDNFIAAAEAWAELPGYSSVDDLSELWKDEYFNTSKIQSLQNGAERWYKDACIKNKITNILRRHFIHLFPDYEQQFSTRLPDISFENLEEIKLTIDIAFGYCFMEGNTFRDEEDFQNFFRIKRDKSWRVQMLQRLRSAEQRVRKGGTFGLKQYVTVERGIWPFRRYEQELQSGSLKYVGIRNMYLNDGAVTKKVAVRTRNEIMKRLHVPIKDFVESITPYFNMTAQQSMDSKV